MMTHSLSCRRVVLMVTLAFIVLTPAQDARAGYCWNWSGHNAINPQPWEVVDLPLCVGSNANHAAGTTVGQAINEEHRNWHCINPIEANDTWGRKFLAFHRQIILDFEVWRLVNTGLGRFEIWDPFQNAPIVGDDETTNTAFTHCHNADFPNPGDNIRPAGALCTNCVSLPAAFVGSNLEDFVTLGELGFNLELMWHPTFHIGVAETGCNDLGTNIFTTRDPAFWMAHKKLDEVVRDWQSLQATDTVLVIDRSGSMDDNCSSTTPPPGEPDCAIEDAKEAARTFANVVEDVRMDGGGVAPEQHRIGLVSFSSTSSPDLGLTAADGIMTDDDVDNTPFELAVTAISTGGNTSIAAGIREAIDYLDTVIDPNPHQAILVLTDGRENTIPCLGGNSPSSCTPVLPEDTLSEAEVGDIQIVAIGFGEAVEEANLRDVAERSGGIFVAFENVDDTLTLQKFFMTAFGEIYDESVNVDPFGTLEAGQTASDFFKIEMCGADDRLTAVVGWKEPAGPFTGLTCDLELELFTPAGVLVSRSHPNVEESGGRRHDFLRVRLPYDSEQAGAWLGRIVRTAGSSTNCERQNYFYTTFVKGFGRIDPFVVRPDLVLGRRILATFRNNETNRPIGGWDSITAEVMLTRPNGAVEIAPLFDDGTNGDATIGNHIFSFEFALPVAETGAYHLRAHFELTKDSCTRVREAEYSIVVPDQEVPDCLSMTCGGVVRVQPGDVFQLDDQPCLWNLCPTVEKYQMEISDTKNWLRTLNPAGAALIPLPPSFQTDDVASFDELCFGPGPRDGNPAAAIPIFVEIPATALIGERSDVSVRATAIGLPGPALNCVTTIEVVPPPDCNDNGIDDAIDIAAGTSLDENLDGVPDECESILDFHSPHIDLEVAAAAVSWTSEAPDFLYDVVRGDLGNLKAQGFAGTTEECLASKTTGFSVPYTPTPAPGEGEWFLARLATAQGHGSYNAGGSRDADIAASGNDCP